MSVEREDLCYVTIRGQIRASDESMDCPKMNRDGFDLMKQGFIGFKMIRKPEKWYLSDDRATFFVDQNHKNKKIRP